MEVQSKQRFSGEVSPLPQDVGFDAAEVLAGPVDAAVVAVELLLAAEAGPAVAAADELVAAVWTRLVVWAVVGPAAAIRGGLQVVAVTQVVAYSFGCLAG